MADYINDLHELIGNTPMLKLHHIEGIREGVNIFAKLEYWNPTGSVKDRTGKYMVEAAEKNGTLKPGGTIIEGTAGNTGLGIAFAAMNKGYHVIFVVPTKFSEEKQTLMRALGATIINTPREKGMLGAVAKANELHASIPDSVMMGQFTNPANPQAHYETTGREIYDQLDGQIDYFVAGAGSGGTYTGIMKYLKEKNPNMTMDLKLVDQVIKVNDDEAWANSRELCSHEGVIVGSSSGAALAAARKLAAETDHGNIVTLFPDRGDRYFSSHLYAES